MNKLFIKTNLSLIHKITMAGFLIALGVVLNKILTISSIPILPFVKISIGGGFVYLLSSLLLGPLFGAVIGVGSDVIGYFIFDMTSFGYFPQISAIYLLLGIFPFFLFSFVRFIKNKKLMMGLEYSVFALVFIFVSLFLFLNKRFELYGTVYTLELWIKFVICGILLLLLFLLIFFNFRLDRKFSDQKMFNIYQVSFVTFICEIFIVMLFGTLMKSWCFGFNLFLPILMTQGILMFLNVPINSYLMMLTLNINQISSAFILEKDGQ